MIAKFLILLSLIILHHKVHHTVSTTSYCQAGITASGRHTYMGEVANNEFPLGTKIRFDHPIFGRRDFVIEDRIGYGSQMDIFTNSCSQSINFGRHQETFVVN